MGIVMVLLIDKGGGSQAVFSSAYVTFCVHMQLHYTTCIDLWGNLFESWSFDFERVAGILTDIIREGNNKGAVGDYACHL